MKKISLRSLKQKLRAAADKNKALDLQRFFKTGPGEYAHGDIFLGVVVPRIRGLAREAEGLALADTFALLRSRFHEERALALVLLIDRFKRSGAVGKKTIYNAYLKHTRFINNWDLVDISAPHIVGAYLFDLDRAPLYRLAKSKDLWERRIAIISTFHFIRNDQYRDTFAIAKMLLEDTHDLIHKGVGWMLREAGKRDAEELERFLKTRYASMPRTMLRYAIERFPEAKRKAYLQGSV